MYVAQIYRGARVWRQISPHEGGLGDGGQAESLRYGWSLSPCSPGVAAAVNLASSDCKDVTTCLALLLFIHPSGMNIQGA